MKNYSLEEKSYNLLKEIDEKRQITPANEPINISFNNISRAFDNVETQTILRKLEKDDGIISIIHISDGVIRHRQRSKYFGHHFTLTDKFYPFLEKLEQKIIVHQNQQINNIKKKIENFSIKTIEDYRVLLNVIKYQQETTITNSDIEIICQENYFEDYQINSDTTKKIIAKLHDDFGIVKIKKFDKGDTVTGYGNFSSIHIEIIENKFFNFMKLIEDQFKKLKGIKNIDSTKDNDLRITYSEHSREILLNNFFLIAKPDFNSENEQVFYYLYKNPNKNITKAEIIEDLKITLTKDFGKIIENLKFKGDLRRAFFDISKNSIQFYNPVSKERLEALGIRNIQIQAK